MHVFNYVQDYKVTTPQVFRYQAIMVCWSRPLTIVMLQAWKLYDMPDTVTCHFADATYADKFVRPVKNTLEYFNIPLSFLPSNVPIHQLLEDTSTNVRSKDLTFSM